MDPVQLFQEYEYDDRDKDLFAKGTLWKKWLRVYPQLFDKKDELLFKRQANMKNGGYKYFECQAAVLLYENYGYWSLLEKYATKSDHPCKKRMVRLLNSLELNRAITYLQEKQGGHGPDLLVYTPTFEEWFFAEVKSPDDEIRDNQKIKFSMLYEITHKPIRLITFRTKATNK
jgi:hypothetical protein